jgi:hypothetical protein
MESHAQQIAGQPVFQTSNLIGEISVKEEAGFREHSLTGQQRRPQECHLLTPKPKGKKELQAACESEFGSSWKRSLDPPPFLRPVLTLTLKYVNNDAIKKTAARSTSGCDLKNLSKADRPKRVHSPVMG